ncbi:hypothetical protein [Mucilaginibacter celer]|uniref:Uncharacterized protein n=1 Tax=Mucilaginibacter celer TaxID=2305508 RepID=A0A494W5P6_9SPHI|nr:hypothetical protein [Mucilaginibacter celer]AYL99123.1 hypothetical protein HYN43_029330 [Mucilaginibacter celer]
MAIKVLFGIRVSVTQVKNEFIHHQLDISFSAQRKQMAWRVNKCIVLQDEWMVNPSRKEQLVNINSNNGIVLLAIVAFIAVALLIRHEKTTIQPVVKLELFKHLSFSTGMDTSFLFGIGLYGSV